MQKTIIFLHIPKTAGTSIRSAFNIMFPFFYFKKLFKIKKGANVIEIYDTIFKSDFVVSNSYNEALSRIGAKTNLIIGHINYGIHNYIKQNYNYITFLRDPVKRTLSFYNYAKVNKQHHLSELFNRNSISTLISDKASLELDNLQTRFFCKEGFTIPFGELEEKHLKEAMHNLEYEITAFGLVEQFDESLVLISKDLDIKPLYYVTKNVTKNVRAANANITFELEKIKTLNKYDIELYNFAKKVFEKRMKGVANFEQKLSRFQKRNNLFNIFFSRIF